MAKKSRSTKKCSCAKRGRHNKCLKRNKCKRRR